MYDDGRVVALGESGLALGIAADQKYVEVRETLDRGSAVVLFTDGVVEARRDTELFGYDRLGRLLADHLQLSARELAQAVVDGARTFSGGAVSDDSAVVVVKRPL